MKKFKLNLIAAACENMGIGKNGDLPWRLKSELKYFSDTTKKVTDPSKKNAVIMGRKTYFGIPESHRPLDDRINIVLTRSANTYDFPSEVIISSSLDDALSKLGQPELASRIENVWIVGGADVYREAMESDHFHRIYFTEIKASFDCDTFFPKIDPDRFRLVPNDPDIPIEVQEEKGIQYVFKIYEKI